MSFPAPAVEPVDGPELDRLITALLNISGLFKQIIEETPGFAADEPDGLAIIGQAADRAHELLDGADEFFGDDFLAAVTDFLALATLVLAQGLGCAHVFQPPGWLN